MKVTTHYDEKHNEYVLRVHLDNGSYAPLGALNGPVEAEIVQSILQGALELQYQVESDGQQQTPRNSFQKGMLNASNIVDGKQLTRMFTDGKVSKIR